MPGPAKRKKSKANRPKPARVNISDARSSEYVPPDEFLESVYHAEGWSDVVDVLCAMFDLPDMVTRSGFKKLHKNFDDISRTLNLLYSFARSSENDRLAGAVIALYAKMSADTILRDRIFKEADFMAMVIPLLDRPVCCHIALQALSSVTHHGGIDVRVQIAKKTSVLLQLLDEQPHDMKAAELTIVVLSHSVASVTNNEQPPDPKLLPLVHVPRLVRTIISFIRKPQVPQMLFDHSLVLLSGAAQHCHREFHAIPSVVNLFVACTRDADIRTRGTGLGGILRLHYKDNEIEDTRLDPRKYVDAVGKRWPDNLTDVLMDYGMPRCETYTLVNTMRDFQVAMADITKDHDFHALGLKFADYILRTEYSISQGAWEVEDPRTGKREIRSIGLPFIWWIDALPLAAKALRDHGSAGELDKADIVHLKYLIIKSRLPEAHVMARKAIERNPHVGFWYYVLTLGADTADGLRIAKQGMKCPNMSDYVRFGLIYRAAEHAMTLALAKLDEAMDVGHNLEEGFALAMCAMEDSHTYIQEAPPDTRSMKSVLYINLLSMLLVKGHELHADNRELKELKRKLQLADDFSTFLSRPISRTQLRLTCTTIIDRMEQAWKEWDTHIPQFSETMPSDISAAAAEDDLAAWLEKVEIADPDIAGGNQHEDDRGYLHPKINFSHVELYRCSWCRNPSALLKKCKGCEKARYCDHSCQKEHWKGHKKVCDRRA